MVNAIKYLAGITEGNPMLIQAYVQMILAHVFAEMPMVDKSTVGSDDLIYNAVEYVAKNFRENISLEKMAYELCVSKYVLSRMFAKTFHCNFSKYVNGVRLNYAVAALENTMDSITNICLDLDLKVKELLTACLRIDTRLHQESTEKGEDLLIKA